MPVETPSFRESVTDAVRFWEPRRILYNAILAGIVVCYFLYFLKASPSLKTDLTLDKLLDLFLLAILANVAYCAAYVVDIFTQWSSYRDLWRHYRWVLFFIGILFAGILTRFFAIGMFSPCCG